MITLTPASMTAKQNSELTPWLEAHGVKAEYVSALEMEYDADANVMAMTVHEYEHGPDGQLRVVNGERVKRAPYAVDVGPFWLPWMIAEPAPVSQPTAKPDSKKGYRHA